MYGTDPENDYIEFKVRICTNLAMTAGCLSDPSFDMTTSQSGWTGQDKPNGGPFVAYNSGPGSPTHAFYTIVPALSMSTTYYWTAQAIDPAGSNMFGTESSPFSFTMNAHPDVPTLDEPLNGASNVTVLPTLKTTTSDPDAAQSGNYIKYLIILCDNTNIGIGNPGCQTFDLRTGVVGWNGLNTLGNTAYTSGTQGSYTLQVVLTGGQTYYWESEAIDPGGSNTMSGFQSAPHFFTTTTQVPTMPHSLLTEGLSDPSSITNSAPNFTAICEDPNVGTLTKFQIQVSTDPNFTSTIWDSGGSGTTLSSPCATGTRSVNMPFGGTTLVQNGTIYYWRVRFTNTLGQVSPWSTEIASFKMNVAYGGMPTACRVYQAPDGSALTLLWIDLTSNETQFEIQRNDNGAGFTALFNTIPNQTSYLDSTVALNHTYQYRVRADFASGSSDWCTTTTTDLSVGTLMLKGLIISN